MIPKSLVPGVVRRVLARASYLLIAILAVPVVFAFSAPAAKAEFIALSGVAFVKRCPCPMSVDGDNSEESNGVLKTVDGDSRFLADVVFPTSGQRICAFRLVYRDVNVTNTIVARLWRKPVIIGGNPFAAPTLLAQVSSAAPVPNTVRVAATTTIASPAINNFTGFYYVEIVSPTFNLDILGVQIDVKASCT